jgi:hypothetical protein
VGNAGILSRGAPPFVHSRAGSWLRSGTVLPSRNHRPPCGAGAARSRHEHDGWTRPAGIIVVHQSTHVFDHAGSPNFGWTQVPRASLR